MYSTYCKSRRTVVSTTVVQYRNVQYMRTSENPRHYLRRLIVSIEFWFCRLLNASLTVLYLEYFRKSAVKKITVEVRAACTKTPSTSPRAWTKTPSDVVQYVIRDPRQLCTVVVVINYIITVSSYSPVLTAPRSQRAVASWVIPWDFWETEKLCTNISDHFL